MQEEVVMYAVMIASGALPAAATAIRGDAFGGGSSLCLLLVALGVVGVCRTCREGGRVPRAYRRRSARRRTGASGA